MVVANIETVSLCKISTVYEVEKQSSSLASQRIVTEDESRLRESSSSISFLLESDIAYIIILSSYNRMVNTIRGYSVTKPGLKLDS